MLEYLTNCVVETDMVTMVKPVDLKDVSLVLPNSIFEFNRICDSEFAYHLKFNEHLGITTDGAELVEVVSSLFLSSVPVANNILKDIWFNKHVNKHWLRKSLVHNKINLLQHDNIVNIFRECCGDNIEIFKHGIYCMDTVYVTIKDVVISQDLKDKLLYTSLFFSLHNANSMCLFMSKLDSVGDSIFRNIVLAEFSNRLLDNRYLVKHGIDYIEPLTVTEHLFVTLLSYCDDVHLSSMSVDERNKWCEKDSFI